MHNLFLEETQGSFSEVTKLLLLSSHSVRSFNRLEGEEDNRDEIWLEVLYSQKIDTLESFMFPLAEVSHDEAKMRGRRDLC